MRSKVLTEPTFLRKIILFIIFLLIKACLNFGQLSLGHAKWVAIFVHLEHMAWPGIDPQILKVRGVNNSSWFTPHVIHGG
jgi:hypothetical protein